MVFIRKDLPLADQLVQVGHVCQVAGRKFDIPSDCHMVLIGVDSNESLSKIAESLECRGIRFVDFYEPDSIDDGIIPMGVTAICSEPITKEQKKYFSRFPLWKP